MLIEGRKRRRMIVQPQLIAMLDVCSMITVFLLSGSVFGPEGLQIPPGTLLASSWTRQTPEAACQIVVTEAGVEAPFLKRRFSFEFFEPASLQATEVISVRESIRKYLQVNFLPSAAAGLTLNVIGDRRVRYSELFNVISFFRDSGFQKMSFIASNERSPE